MTNSGGFSTYSEEFLEEERKFQALEKRLISEATILEGAVYHHFNADGSFAGISQGEPLPSTAAERAAARKKIEISETREIVEEVAPPPEKLNALQLESYVKLIQTNPPDPKWQKIIKDLKKQYPEQLGNIKEVDGDKLDDDQFDTLVDNTSFYQKQVDVVLKNASLTTGMTF